MQVFLRAPPVIASTPPVIASVAKQSGLCPHSSVIAFTPSVIASVAKQSGLCPLPFRIASSPFRLLAMTVKLPTAPRNDAMTLHSLPDCFVALWLLAMTVKLPTALLAMTL